MAESSDGPLGVIQTENDDVSRRFGPNTAEVEAFIQAVARLTPTEWKKVVAARKLVASVTKEGSGEAPDELQSIRAAMGSGEGRVSESMTRVGEALFEALETQTDENVVAAWQAVSALVLRQQLSALKFAAHYVPFATLIPVLGVSALDPTTRRFLSSLKRLTADQCASLARPWRLEHNTSRALLQAVANRGHLHVEEAVALRALATIPARLSGDAGWAAVRTVVHGGRVLSRRADLASDEVTVLWAPLQEMIPLESLEKVRGDEGAPKRVRAVTTKRTKPVKPPKVVVAKPPKAAALYGPNSAEVAAFVKAVVELTPIQWLRVLDRRQLVSSVTREGSAEPATVALDGVEDVLAGCAAVPGPGAHGAGALGGDHEVVAPAPEPSPQDLLGAAHGVEGAAQRIDVGRVEEGDSPGGRAVEDGDRGGLVALQPEGHRAETEAGDLEAGAAEADMAHGTPSNGDARDRQAPPPFA